jgi:hypothetical protein
MIPSSRMPYPRTLSWLLFCLTLLVSFPAFASPSTDVEKNVELLRTSSDFRVRTQAALALGASGSGRAVTPLCDALTDGSRTVRIASATAISRLRQGGESCLKARLNLEKDAAVLSALKNALERLAGGGAEPAIGPSTKYFVAIQTLAGPERLNAPVRAAFVKEGRSNSQVAFAPAGQTQEQAAAALEKHRGAKGFLLAPRLSRPVYDGGMLQVQMSVAILSYPGNALIGTFSKNVGMGGVTSQNTEAENELVVLVAEEAMKQFLVLAPTLL